MDNRLIYIYSVYIDTKKQRKPKFEGSTKYIVKKISVSYNKPIIISLHEYTPVSSNKNT